MKILKLLFSHPVQGRARVSQSGSEKAVRLIDCSSDENHEIEISLKDLPPGIWNILFEWEQNGDSFFLKDTLIITD